MKVTVIGSGSWGTALALKAHAANHEVKVYCRTSQECEDITQNKENKLYLPGISIPDSILFTANPVEAIKGSDLVLIVVPSQAVREVVRVFSPLITPEMTIVSCAKGLEKSSGKRMSEVLEEEISHVTTKLGILSGPNHAEEIGANLPAATVIASTDPMVFEIVQKGLGSSLFRIYSNSDVIGVELAGTTKNIIALATGIAEGLALGDNLKAALLTRGLVEMKRFGSYFGANAETYCGLAGMGDLIATCMSCHSRNRSAGIQLAHNRTKEQILEEASMVIEGFYAVEIVSKMATNKGISMPITEALQMILDGKRTPREALIDLMTRTPKDEREYNMDSF